MTKRTLARLAGVFFRRSAASSTRNRHAVRHGSLSVETLESRLAMTSFFGQLDWPGAAARLNVTAYRSSAQASGDAGETFSTAADLGPLRSDQAHRGSVGSSDRLDIVRFELLDDAELSIGLDALRADVDLYLYNDRGRLIERSIDPGTSTELIERSLTAGDYYVAISPYTWPGSTYRLSLGVDYPSSSPEVPNRQPTGVLPDVAYYGGRDDWNLNAINAPEAWAQGYLGQGVTVAVVDTGVDLQHPELVDSLWTNTDEIPGNNRDDDGNGYVDDVYGWDFASGDANPDDRNGHGTHVAGVIAAGRNGYGATGVAPETIIMPVRVLGDGGSGTNFSVAAGIRYAAENGADIINLSLGGGYSQSILSAIDYAGRLGSLVVAAAGNESSLLPSYPARYSESRDHVISVGAHSSSSTVASFSNDVGRSEAVQVDAPGVGVYSTLPNGRYGRLSGTSMAAPHVSGLAALAISARRDLRPTELRRLLVAGANRTVQGSDAQGGANAAATVAMAATV